MQTESERAQINLLLVAATWLDLRAWLVDTADVAATVEEFEKAVRGVDFSRLDEAIGRAVTYYYGREAYRQAAQILCQRLRDAGLLLLVRTY